MNDVEVVLVCGPGGVGKTTVAAAIGAATAATRDARVLVVTVDPARRLADALGIETLGNAEVVVAADRFPQPPKGSLSAAMLDTVGVSGAPGGERDEVCAQKALESVAERLDFAD